MHRKKMPKSQLEANFVLNCRYFVCGVSYKYASPLAECRGGSVGLCLSENRGYPKFNKELKELSCSLMRLNGISYMYQIGGVLD
jgi:hypothetical protein